MSSPSPGTSSEAAFTPRREFIKEESHSTNSFALLALSSVNCIRLYSFTPETIDSLRRFFEQTSLILSFRQDTEENLWEFVLDRKPWANAKSVFTEKLLVDIMTLIYHCGYSYLSTLDYGREADDRLAMAFSKPDVSVSRSCPPFSSPSPTEPIPLVAEKPCRVKRVPFALSFASVTVMRVISPPLHLTPAILQAVRASWPRGVVSERKVADNSYEFKLKGYKWFQQDTFATDSLRHILSLLSSLDAHSFSLLASISLTNRSRVKDLWIFTGPTSESGSLPDILDHSDEHLSHVGSSPNVAGTTSNGPTNHISHRRLATEPTPATPYSPILQHQRNSTESASNSRVQQHQVLRKPAPRAQIPVSVVQEPEIELEPEVEGERYPVRTYMPSVVSANVENMTGIGARPKLLYETPPIDVGDPFKSSLFTSSGLESEGPPDLHRPPLRPVSERAKTPPLLMSSTTSSPRKVSEFPISSLPEEIPRIDETSPRLLGIGTFRDSAFSSNSELSCEVPIKWTGPLRDELTRTDGIPRIKSNRISSTPNLPGAWQPTPIAEKPEAEYPLHAPHPSGTDKKTTPVHELSSRFDSPEVTRPEMPLRKSEAALVGIIQSTSSPVPLPNQSGTKSPQTPGGKGWVLVNVDNSGSTTSPERQGADTPEPRPLQYREPSPERGPAYHSISPQPEQPSSTAKAIVVIDALESKHKKSKSTSNPKQVEGGSGVRRFFSLNRKNSKRIIDDEEKTRNSDKSAPHSIPRSNLRDKLRLIGTPEASRREDKRRSID